MRTNHCLASQLIELIILNMHNTVLSTIIVLICVGKGDFRYYPPGDYNRDYDNNYRLYNRSLDYSRKYDSYSRSGSYDRYQDYGYDNSYGDRSNDRSYDSSYYSCTGKTPQFPNYIEPVNNFDSFRSLGKWYIYAEWRGTPTAAVPFTLHYNPLIYVSNLTDLTIEPSTNTDAYVLEELYTRVDRTTRKCLNSAAVGFLNADGVFKSTLFDGFGPNVDASKTTIQSAPALVLYTDYDTMAIIYYCYRYNTATGICELVDMNVITRTRPDQLLSKTITNIASAVNKELGRYCFDMSLMTTAVWLPQLQDCPVVRPADLCYANLLYGMFYYAADDTASNALVAQYFSG
ncbi:uncharacterized protein LOC129591126 [Paramacrobiotus metropolitanus]|uniref:uncharacterized protein LOC129591126 n=1 Tax=Paramacrobiotus metropolitanus TaxID=2943436 RepID=UPI0024457462|nr:uncharacterized protein LOC129591126 [Paramacrobiotus metropolitanus]